MVFYKCERRKTISSIDYSLPAVFQGLNIIVIIVFRDSKTGKVFEYGITATSEHF